MHKILKYNKIINFNFKILHLSTHYQKKDKNNFKSTPIFYQFMSQDTKAFENLLLDVLSTDNNKRKEAEADIKTAKTRDINSFLKNLINLLKPGKKKGIISLIN